MDAHCPCGAVTLRLEGEPLAQVFCHCNDCQRAHGAAYVPRAIYPRERVMVQSGDVRRWKARVRTMVICASCGSHLFGEHEASTVRGVNAGLFPEGRFQPTLHLHCAHAVAPVLDRLPHYADAPVGYGGTGALMDWPKMPESVAFPDSVDVATDRP